MHNMEKFRQFVNNTCLPTVRSANKRIGQVQCCFKENKTPPPYGSLHRHVMVMMMESNSGVLNQALYDKRLCRYV